MESFWDKLPKPIFAVAPMEDVTDAAFRRIIACYGKPAVMFTEFTSADGLVLADRNGQKILRRKLMFDESERPIVAQLFTADVERMERAAAIVHQLGFDGLDINMGCPVDEVVRSGAGAALIKDHKLARELVQAARRGAPKLPLSIKTRIGYRENELDSWLPALLEVEPVAITIHARTRNDMSAVPAQWDTVAQAVQIRDRRNSKSLIIGNGDVKTLADARAKVAATKCDGVMFGRAIYGNPWLFSGLRNHYSGFVNRYIPTSRERLEALAEHLMLFDELLGDTVNYATMKKHFKAYVSGWDGAKELRIQLMETKSLAEAKAILDESIVML